MRTPSLIEMVKEIVEEGGGDTQNKPREMIQHQLLDGCFITVTYSDTYITHLGVFNNQ